MRTVKAFDVNGTEIKSSDIVKIVKTPDVKHAWLKVGNTLRVSHWEDRALGKTEYICVFLKSKKGGKQCSLGVQDIRLEVIND